MGEEEEGQEGVQLEVGHQGVQGCQKLALAQVTVIIGGEKQAVGGTIFIKNLVDAFKNTYNEIQAKKKAEQEAAEQQNCLPTLVALC